jgi:hypothetical protein
MSRIIVCLIFLLVFAMKSQAAPLHWTVLDIPVLIELIENKAMYHGTGAVLNRPDGGYLVTAKHVFYNMSSNKLISKNARILSYQGIDRQREPSILELKLDTLENNKTIKTHSTHDVAVIQLSEKIVANGQEGLFYKDGVSVISGSNILRIVDDRYLRRLNNIAISQDVFVFGYPISIGISGYQQFEPFVPLIRKCIVSGKNNTRKTLIIDCPVYHGNSGGPVIATYENTNGDITYEMIGLVTEYIPFKMDKIKTRVNDKTANDSELVSNSGYTVVEPIDFALELIPAK